MRIPAATGLAIVALGLGAAACSASGDGEGSTTATTQAATGAVTTTIVPGITKAAETPTPVPSATATPGLPDGPPAVELVDAFPSLPDLARPVELVNVPVRGGSVYVVALQDGRVLWWTGDPGFFNIEGLTALDIRDQVSRAGNEEGLLGMALDPLFFEGRNYMYLYYSVEPGERRTRLSRFDVTISSEPGWRLARESELVILEVPQPFSNHNGGKIAFGPDGMLYIGLGDGGSGGDPQGNGQDPGTLLGSFLRIDVSESTTAEPYRIPADNPFADGVRGRPETWAWGFRNPWRFSFDRETGDLWAGDVGQNAWEEIDVVEAGRNYGWNLMEGTHCYRPASGCDQAGLELPVAEYDHSGGRCSVTGGYVYRGEGNPALRGYYVYADFCSGEVWALEAAGRGEPVQLIEEGPPIASFAEDAEGELYALSFDGQIYRLEAP